MMEATRLRTRMLGARRDSRTSRSAGTPRASNAQGLIARPKSLLTEERLQQALSALTTRRDDKVGNETRALIDECVEALEQDGGIRDPTSSSVINGRWRLLYTTRPGSSSPIQRAFTGTDSFRIYQDVSLEAPARASVANVVVFGQGLGELNVAAEAVTDTRPQEGFVPRQGAGLALFGESSCEPPDRRNKRIDFQFSDAAFDFPFLPFKVPYPVPFRLLKDESKGWLDTTYMSDALRISRGNKGTLFILAKERPASEQLLEAIAEEDDATIAVESFVSQQSPRRPAEARELLKGAWKLEWTEQSDGASAIQKLATSFDNFQVLSGSRRGEVDELENVARFLPGVTLRARASCEPSRDAASRFDVTIEGAKVSLGPLEVPLKITGDGWLDLLYVDETVRVSRGSKGSLFVHSRYTEGDV